MLLPSNDSAINTPPAQNALIPLRPIAHASKRKRSAQSAAERPIVNSTDSTADPGTEAVVASQTRAILTPLRLGTTIEETQPRRSRPWLFQFRGPSSKSQTATLLLRTTPAAHETASPATECWENVQTGAEEMLAQLGYLDIGKDDLFGEEHNRGLGAQNETPNLIDSGVADVHATSPAILQPRRTCRTSAQNDALILLRPFARASKRTRSPLAEMKSAAEWSIADRFPQSALPRSAYG
ncbi:uncharacterized protein BDZ99DRAFT_493604 [Mytilinidion resinicola]|uniref:Uncharacterized protein n=1 Tax=Mytilinidion resinicola TaxID=574789 RepID=A0A6A6Z4K5_9PEZI|nr:uncharacterized protein BDZ99DRAFT_493604 [Mytilinidion resinicola]KAF2815593.1 hypothetical protein BDZ99DRAFT_493604 [Mytilinidion resinicola]